MAIKTEQVGQQHRGPFERPRHVEVPVESLDVLAYLIPTEGPKSDRTFEWDTLLVLVEARGGGHSGLGYMYGS